MKGIILIIPAILITSCSVVKTPYFQTEYFHSSITSLENNKDKINTVNDSLYSGFSRVSITPGLNDFPGKKKHGKGIPIAGFGRIRTKYATGVHDSVYVRSVALKSGGQMAVITSADLLIMPPNIIDSVTAGLAREGIRRDQLFFSAAHTHSGIGGWGYGPLAKLMAGKENKQLETWLAGQIINSVLEAISDLQQARLGSGHFNASPYTGNRLTGDQDQINNEFNYIVIEQTNGRKGIIGSFSAHATTIRSVNTLISADYPGYWAGKIEGPAISVAMFCGGSMGNQSPRGNGSEKDYDNARFIGEALADSLLNGMKKVKMSGKLSTASVSLKIDLPEYHMRMTKNRNFSTGISRLLMARPENVYLQCLKINNLLWFFTPGDFSGETAHLIKNVMAGKGYESVISGYNGSYVGYILPGKYFWLDSYEARTMGWFGPTMGDYITDLLFRMGNDVIGK